MFVCSKSKTVLSVTNYAQKGKELFFVYMDRKLKIAVCGRIIRQFKYYKFTENINATPLIRIKKISNSIVFNYDCIFLICYKQMHTIFCFTSNEFRRCLQSTLMLFVIRHSFTTTNEYFIPKITKTLNVWFISKFVWFAIYNWKPTFLLLLLLINCLT